MIVTRAALSSAVPVGAPTVVIPWTPLALSSLSQQIRYIIKSYSNSEVVVVQLDLSDDGSSPDASGPITNQISGAGQCSFVLGDFNTFGYLRITCSTVSGSAANVSWGLVGF